MGGKSKTKTSTDNTIDPWSKQQYESGKARVQGVLDQNPYQAYTGDRVAGISGMEQQALENYPGMAQTAMGMLGQGFEAAQAARPSYADVNYQSIAGQDLSGYMNPYTNEVIDRSISDMDRARRMAIAGQEASTHPSAFGGARQGVSDALTNERFIDQAGNLAAGLRSGAFQNAQGLALEEAGRNLGAGQFNANNRMQLSRDELARAGLLGSMAGQFGDMGARDAQLMTMLGTNERAIEQAGLDAQYQEFIRAQEDPYRRAQLQLGLLGSTPIIQDSASTSTQKQTPGIAGILGTGIGLAGDLGWSPFG